MPDLSPLDRGALRRQLLNDRQAWILTPQALEAQAALQARLLTVVEQLEPMCLGVYWPMQGEFNPRDLAVLAQDATGCRLALPFARRAPVEMHFREWNGQEPDTVDECRIPAPSGRPIEPDVVLVPCVGFTEDGWRLGYGGGYFDRYLSAHPGITAIGVAWQNGLLSGTQWQAQAHDQPLLAVITEQHTYGG
ncbi:5-formyltetrahydrofolate cyclo-ligase [Aquabacterium sp.]|uniref:5-formyltetrahydrofolate cyclo-ligase n=1 Tax=Aquabacterium sp. TaxID=1872578 RepID=UPI002E334B86|nr:5-formyltetrahydrofolate cyclo-ligase [Aquabacterium sp.]HEX5311208.1 5-formyltetrahydrofolate cyclo-ligase [Aquabacterium sp.]